MQGLRLEPRPP